MVSRIRFNTEKIQGIIGHILFSLRFLRALKLKRILERLPGGSFRGSICVEGLRFGGVPIKASWDACSCGCEQGRYTYDVL